MKKVILEWNSAKAPILSIIQILRWPSDEPLKNTEENARKLIDEYNRNKYFRDDFNYLMYFDEIM